ncbi:MAG: tetratricopeptide repeat protein [bacterium]|jgi:type II secretory pathway component GspD/PulD (secretin)/Flp pilus assembly protein TadD
MYLTCRWNHHCLTRFFRTFAFVLLMGGLTVVWCVTPSANTLMRDVFAHAVTTAAKAQTKTVKAQVDNFLSLARKEIRSGNVERARELLQQVLILDPQNKKAKDELVKLTGTAGSIAPRPAIMAAAATPASINYDDMSSTELVDASKALMRDGEYETAKSILEKALKKSRDDNERRAIHAYLNAIDKEMQRGTVAMQQQLDYNLSELDSLLRRAMIYLENKQYAQADAELQRAKTMAPGDERVLKLLAQVNQAQGTQSQQRLVAEVKDQKRQLTQEEAAADVLFEEGVIFYRQGRIIEAVEKWRQAIHVHPNYQPAHTYIANTMLEYEKALEQRQEKVASLEADSRFEQMLDTQIPQYSTQGERVDVKDVYSLLSTLSGLNFVLAENLEGQVAMDVKNTNVREILNLLQKQYGFVWDRDGDTIFVEQGFVTRIFPLSEGQYKTIELILNDPSTLEDSSRNLRTILYGPTEEFEVPGKQLYLNKTSQSLVVTDTEANVRQVEAFLEDMPQLIGDQRPLETRVYQVDKDIARDVYEILKLVLFEGRGSRDLRDPRRMLFLEPDSNSLIVRDYPENIDQVEQILADQQITRRLEEGELQARQFTIADVDDVEDTPEAQARRDEFVGAIAEVLEHMLYGREGREAAMLQGRMLIANPLRGTIDVVDTSQKIRLVEEYLNSVRRETTQDILIEVFPIQHVDVFTIADALAFLFFDAQQSTRALFLSQNIFQSVGTSEQADVLDAGDLFEETTRDRFNLTGGGGGGTDLLQFFSVRFYPDSNTNSIVVFTPDQEAIDLTSRVISTFDKPQRMIELENRVVTVSLTDLRSINFDYFLSNPLIGDFDFDPEVSENNIGFIQGDVNESQGGINFSYRTFGQSRLDFLMTLLESTSSLNLLSAPKLITVANPITPPQLFVGQQIPYADDVNFEDQGDDDPTNNRLVATFNRTLAGVSLAFLPFILNDDHIYLEMAPNIIEPGERLPVGITGEAPPGQAVPNIGPLLLNQKFVQTSVRLKNGSTVVLGGLIDEKENERLEKVPLLHKIPFLGALFTDRNIEKTKNSTLVFVTVRIIEPEY